MVRRPFSLSSAVWRRRNVQRMEVYYRLILSTQTFVLFIVWSKCCLEQNYFRKSRYTIIASQVSTGVNLITRQKQLRSRRPQLWFWGFSSLSQMFDMG